MAIGYSPLTANGPLLRGLQRNRLLGQSPFTPTGGRAAGPMAASDTTPAPVAPAPAAPAPVAAPVAHPSWEVHPLTGLMPNWGSGFLGSVSSLLNDSLRAGYFDPGANQGILDMVRSNALSDASAAQDRASLQAQNLGADTATSASAALRAGLQGQGDVARAVNAAALPELTHQRDFLQNLLFTLMGRQGAQNTPTSGTDLGSLLSMLGQLGAAGIGKIP